MMSIGINTAFHLGSTHENCRLKLISESVNSLFECDPMQCKWSSCRTALFTMHTVGVSYLILAQKLIEE